MSLPYAGKLIPYARELRKNATKQERRLWYNFLSTYPIRFQRQKAIRGFIADFYCHKAKLVIELDGSQHRTKQGQAYDIERSAVLAEYGLLVLRFSNSDIDRRFDDVCKKIHSCIKKRTSVEEIPPPWGNSRKEVAPTGGL